MRECASNPRADSSFSVRIDAVIHSLDCPNLEDIELGMGSFEKSQCLLLRDNASLRSLKLENGNFMTLQEIEVSRCPNLQTVLYRCPLRNKPKSKMEFSAIPASAMEALQKWCNV